MYSSLCWTTETAPLHSALGQSHFPQQPTSRLDQERLYQLPDKKGHGVTNICAGNSVLEAWVETKERGVAEVEGETDKPASKVMFAQNVPPEIAVQYGREENVTLCK